MNVPSDPRKGSVYRTDTKIFSIEGYTALVDGEAVKYAKQWQKDFTAFKWQVTLQVTSGVIAECPSGIFVNIYYVTSKDALAFYKALKLMFDPANGLWHITLSRMTKIASGGKRKELADGMGTGRSRKGRTC